MVNVKCVKTSVSYNALLDHCFMLDDIRNRITLVKGRFSHSNSAHHLPYRYWKSSVPLVNNLREKFIKLPYGTEILAAQLASSHLK